MFTPQNVTLLSGVAVNANGDSSFNTGGLTTGIPWYYIGRWTPGWTVITTGIAAGDKTQIWLSNKPSDTPPTAFTAAQGAFQLGNDITADGVVEVDSTHSWIAIRKTAFAGGGAIVVQASAIGQ